jgi:hypothetical protein
MNRNPKTETRIKPGERRNPYGCLGKEGQSWKGIKREKIYLHKMFIEKLKEFRIIETKDEEGNTVLSQGSITFYEEMIDHALIEAKRDNKLLQWILSLGIIESKEQDIEELKEEGRQTIDELKKEYEEIKQFKKDNGIVSTSS